MNWINIKSSLISALLMGLIMMGGYILEVGSLYKVDVKSLLDVGFMAVITAGVSLLKSLLTTNAGKFAGVVKIK